RHDGSVRELEITGAGIAVGLVFGLFGAGGSAFATPVLAMLGVPGFAAVASPLPAVMPAALGSARHHLRTGRFDHPTARLAVSGGLPGTTLGALASRAVGGPHLVVLSAFVLLIAGGRVAWPARAHARRDSCRVERAAFIVPASFAVGVVSGLLANGGGF